MDPPETSVHSLAAVDTSLHSGTQSDAARIDGGTRVDVRYQRTRPMVERRSLSHERGLPKILLRSTWTRGTTPSATAIPAHYRNRRGTEPYARWCGGTAGAIPPPTRLTTVFPDRLDKLSIYDDDRC